LQAKHINTEGVLNNNS